MTDEDRPRLTDVELAALAAMVQGESQYRESYDAHNRAQGGLPYYTMPSLALSRLEAELERRGIL